MSQTLERITAGTTKDCFRDFTVQTENKPELRERLCEFAEVNFWTTSRHWFKGRLPNGENLLRLRFFLELMDYDVLELRNLEKEAYELAKAIAYRLVSVEQASEELNFKHSRDGMLRLALGKVGTTISRKESAKRLTQKIQMPLADLVLRWKRVLGVANKPESTAHPAAEPASVHPSNNGSMSSTKGSAGMLKHEEVLSTLGHMVSAILPLVTVVLSDEFSEEERRQLREEVPGHGIFKLSTGLGRLCSETARRSINQTQDTRKGVR